MGLKMGFILYIYQSFLLLCFWILWFGILFENIVIAYHAEPDQEVAILLRQALDSPAESEWGGEITQRAHIMSTTDYI